jgi:hypothetical protein
VVLAESGVPDADTDPESVGDTESADVGPE